MNALLAVVPRSDRHPQPDAAWIKKHVPILAVAHELGLRIRHRRARCWRVENHRHGDADPSLHFYERNNRVRCFVCDMRGGNSNIDLVMGFLCIPFGDAVRWIAERFTVPNVKPGRPLGRRSGDSVLPYRVGVNGSEFEVLVRSGMFGQLSSAARSILIVLAIFRDPDSGLTRMSYAAICRYAGVGSSATVSASLKRLARLHAIQIHPGARTGLTRECSAYRVTLDDAEFYASCSEIFQLARVETSLERAHRAELRQTRQRLSPRQVSTRTRGREEEASSLALRAHPTPKPTNHPSTCEGQDLSSVVKVNSNKTLQCVKHEISLSGQRSVGEQEQILRERGLL